MSTFNELLQWCKNNCRLINRYYEDITDSLSCYSCAISSQSNCFTKGLMYYVNQDEQLIWIYYGKGPNMYGDAAAAITIKCDQNNASYSYYKILDEDKIPDIDENETEYWECINNWKKDNYVFEKLSIFSAIEKFNQYANTNIKLSLEDPSKILTDFIYKIDDSLKLEVQSEYDNIDDFFIDNEINTLVICTADTKLPIIKIEKYIIDQKISFKFIVDITNEDGDNFSIKTTIKSKENLYEKLQETIESLRAHKEFTKYANDLENCL